MKKKVKLSDLEIANRIKAGIDFLVSNESARKRALMAARVLDKRIVTASEPDGGFRVVILHPINQLNKA